MAELDYEALADMSTLVTELTGSTPSDLESLLVQSAGKHTSETVTVYRPYYVAARILRRQRNTSRLRAAEGTEFDSPSVTIAGLMQEHAAEDARLLDTYSDYEVPVGHTAGSRLTF